MLSPLIHTEPREQQHREGLWVGFFCGRGGFSSTPERPWCMSLPVWGKADWCPTPVGGVEVRGTGAPSPEWSKPREAAGHWLSRISPRFHGLSGKNKARFPRTRPRPQRRLRRLGFSRFVSTGADVGREETQVERDCGQITGILGTQRRQERAGVAHHSIGKAAGEPPGNAAPARQGRPRGWSRPRARPVRSVPHVSSWPTEVVPPSHPPALHLWSGQSHRQWGREADAPRREAGPQPHLARASLCSQAGLREPRRGRSFSGLDNLTTALKWDCVWRLWVTEGPYYLGVSRKVIAHAFTQWHLKAKLKMLSEYIPWVLLVQHASYTCMHKKYFCSINAGLQPTFSTWYYIKDAAVYQYSLIIISLYHSMCTYSLIVGYVSCF